MPVESEHNATCDFRVNQRDLEKISIILLNRVDIFGMGVGGGGFLTRNSTAPAITITSAAAAADVDAAIAAAATSMLSIFSFDGKCRFPLRRKQLTGLCNQITMVNLIRRCSLQNPPPPHPTPSSYWKDCG